MDEQKNSEIEQLVRHLQSPRQVWLLGAGISRNAGIPLMFPLTERIVEILDDGDKKSFKEIFDLLNDNSHVEHVLSQIGDLIEIAGRAKDGEAQFGSNAYDKNQLIHLHGKIITAISKIIRSGFIPKDGDQAEVIGELNAPIVKVDDHRNFIRAIFYHLRTNLDKRRPPVKFFTTNYDTLLEDALSLERIGVYDCFSGGGMAYWNPKELNKHAKAEVYKLHGSIDWYLDKETKHLFRYRDGSGYPPRDKGNILIYPQSTKYVETQRDPFAYLFSCFRQSLSANEENTLVICGYSFGDEHINAEIESMLNQEENKTTIVAFTYEGDGGLPETLENWLCKGTIKRPGRIFVASNKGLYRGDKDNLLPDGLQCDDWWTFKGLTELLEQGMSYFGEVE